MPVPLRVVLFALGLLASATTQQTAIAPASASDAAARARLEKALGSPARRHLAVDLAWQETLRGMPAVETRVSGTCAGEVMHLRAGDKEWLVSARNDLIRVDDNWFGARPNERGPGFAPGILAALQRCPFEVMRREVGMVDDRPVEVFSLRVPAAAATHLVLLAKPPLFQASSVLGSVMTTLSRPVAQAGGAAPPHTEVAVTIDPAMREVRSFVLRFSLGPDQAAAEPSEWKDGLPVRGATQSAGVLVRFKAAAPGCMPPLDMDLQTRLLMRFAPVK